MRKQIDHRKCDHCGKVVEQSEMQFGGSPFSGWLTVERTDGSTRIPRANNGPWDFCGTACCIAFLSANTVSHRPSEPEANEGCLQRLVGGVCNDPFHPEWYGKQCQCVTCQPVNYCVENPCLDCTGPVDGCEPPDEDANTAVTDG